MVDQVLFPPREEIIDHDHAVPTCDQTVHEMAPYEPGPTRDHDPKTLPLQPERDLSRRIQNRRPERGHVVWLEGPRGDPAWGLGDGRVDRANVRLGAGSRDDDEEEGGDGDSDEDEDEALLAEQVAGGAGDGGQPGFWGFRGVSVGRVLGVVASVNQVCPHLPNDFFHVF